MSASPDATAPVRLRRTAPVAAGPMVAPPALRQNLQLLPVAARFNYPYWLAGLAGLLLLVALSLLDLARWRQLFSLSRTDFGVALATLVATVTIRLEMATATCCRKVATSSRLNVSQSARTFSNPRASE